MSMTFEQFLYFTVDAIQCFKIPSFTTDFLGRAPRGQDGLMESCTCGRGGPLPNPKTSPNLEKSGFCCEQNLGAKKDLHIFSTHPHSCPYLELQWRTFVFFSSFHRYTIKEQICVELEMSSFSKTCAEETYVSPWQSLHFSFLAVLWEMDIFSAIWSNFHQRWFRVCIGIMMNVLYSHKFRTSLAMVKIIVRCPLWGGALRNATVQLNLHVYQRMCALGWLF